MKPATTALAALLLFGTLTVAVMSGATQPFDAMLRDKIHATASPILTSLAFGASSLGSTAFTIAAGILAAAGFSWRKQHPVAKAMIAVMAGALIWNFLLKNLIQRPRPDAFFGALPETFSFPSGHVLFSTCCYGMCALVLSAQTPIRALRVALWSAAVLLVTAIGWSRQYLGVHYPTDVLAGALVGIGWIGLVRATTKWA